MNEQELNELRDVGIRMGLRREALAEWLEAQKPAPVAKKKKTSKKKAAKKS